MVIIRKEGGSVFLTVVLLEKIAYPQSVSIDKVIFLFYSINSPKWEILVTSI